MTFEAYVQGFGCLPNATPYNEATAVVLPIPLEWGSGETPGVGLGPMAVLGASRFLETYDTDLGFDPLDRIVATLDPPSLSYDDPSCPFQQIEEHLGAVHRDGKRPVCIGGDRVLALPVVRAAARHHGPVGVVAFFRRPGLLDRHAGRAVSPPTLGRRLAEEFPTAILGPRWWSAAEAAAINEAGAPPVIPARELPGLPERLPRLARQLPRHIHISIDVGVLAPAVLPISGNVEPGGLDWYALIDALDAIFARFTVVSCDVSGLVPVIGQVAPSLLVAQLVLRCLGRMT